MYYWTKCDPPYRHAKSPYFWARKIDFSSCITDPVDMLVNTYKNHSSILLMKQKLENVGHLLFKDVSICEIEKEFRKSDLNKVTMFDNIPTKILKYITKTLQ